jgi:hypothetical protein
MQTKSIRVALLVITFAVSCTAVGDAIKDNGDGTATDKKTGLMWEEGKDTSKTYQGAARYCEGLSLAGYSDWGLPKKDQLVSLWKDSGFRSKETEFYWSYQTDPETMAFGSLAWIVSFEGWQRLTRAHLRAGDGELP